MTTEPQLDEISEENQAPATKADIAELAQMTAKSFETVATKDELAEVKTDVKDIKKKMDTLATKEGTDAVLKALEANTAAMNELRTLPARVERLERSVFRR